LAKGIERTEGCFQLYNSPSTGKSSFPFGSRRLRCGWVYSATLSRDYQIKNKEDDRQVQSDNTPTLKQPFFSSLAKRKEPHLLWKPK